MPAATPSRPAPHYAWVVMGVTFLTLLAAAGVRATPGVLFVPLGAEFGWDRSTVSLAVSVNILLYGLVGQFEAGVMVVAGLRRTMHGAWAVLDAAGDASVFISTSWTLDTRGS